MYRNWMYFDFFLQFCNVLSKPTFVSFCWKVKQWTRFRFKCFAICPPVLLYQFPAYALVCAMTCECIQKNILWLDGLNVMFSSEYTSERGNDMISTGHVDKLVRIGALKKEWTILIDMVWETIYLSTRSVYTPI